MKTLETDKPYNRRKFIKNTALGIGIMAAGLPVASISARASNKKEKKLGIALVGLGYYATDELGPALLETANCYLAGIVTGTKEKEKIWSEKYNIPEKNIYNYDNFDDIAKNDDIDIVYIVLPNSMHAEYTIRAARAKKHVLCEKPMAVSVEECQKMIDICKLNNVKLSVGYRLHYDPYHKKIMELGFGEAYGPAKFIDSSFCWRIGDNPDVWRLKKDLAGGAIMDVGIYSIQAARYSTGEEPISVIAREYKSDPVKFSEVDDTVIFQLEFPGGAIANCSSSFSFNSNRLDVSFERGVVRLHSAYGYRGAKGLIQDQNWRVPNVILDYPEINQQATHMDDFAQNIIKNTESIVSGAEGVLDLKVVEAIRESMKHNGKQILINQ
ncbi:Gfo/Idh/MocA family protein [Bacteroidota bacterium]